MGNNINNGWYGNSVFRDRVSYYNLDMGVRYGFDSCGNWYKDSLVHLHDLENKFYFNSNTLRNNFINYIKRLGFKEGCHVKETFEGTKNYQIIGSDIEISYDFSFILLGNTIIYKEGIWLEVVEEQNTVIPTETYYYYKNNFYKVDETVKTKSGDKWEDYVIYVQTGSGLRFSRPAEIFYKKFKKVEV